MIYNRYMYIAFDTPKHLCSTGFQCRYNLPPCSGYISDTHRYTTEAYVQSSATISDCFVEQIIGISRIRCAILDKTLNGFAFVYDGKTQVCHICLAPYIAGTIERLSPPAGLPIWMRGKMWLIDHLNCRKSSVTECNVFNKFHHLYSI